MRAALPLAVLVFALLLASGCAQTQQAPAAPSISASKTVAPAPAAPIPVANAGAGAPNVSENIAGAANAAGQEAGQPAQQKAAEAACPYECCVSGNYAKKECAGPLQACRNNRCAWQGVDLAKPVPPSYHIKDVPYVGERNFCYGASSMMLMRYIGFSEADAQNYRTVVKTGPGGPPDIFIGFMKFNLSGRVHIGYSKNFVEEYGRVYDTFLQNADEQKILFDSRAQALDYLKRLVSSDVPVMVIIHYGNHYAVVTGYDADYIYTNDPGLDSGYEYKIDADPNLEQRRLRMGDFLDEWSISQQEKSTGGHLGFPGDQGIIWLVK